MPGICHTARRDLALVLRMIAAYEQSLAPQFGKGILREIDRRAGSRVIGNSIPAQFRISFSGFKISHSISSLWLKVDKDLPF
jgi:hypothetical protein